MKAKQNQEIRLNYAHMRIEGIKIKDKSHE